MSVTKTAARTLAIAVAGSLALTACGSGGDGGDGGTVTLNLQWWGNDDRAERYEAAVRRFEDANPGIRVRTGFAGWDDYWPARNTEAAGNSLPDVLQMDTSYLRQYANTGQLADLSEHAGDALDVSGVDDDLVKSGEIDGALYAVATGTNTMSLVYNPGLVEELGAGFLDEDYTWQDYHDYALAAAEAGADRSPRVYGSEDHTTVFWLFMQWLIQEGVEPFTDDGELGFTEQHMKDWLNSAAELRERNATYPVERTVQLMPLGGFTEQEIPMIFHWDNFLASYTADSGVDDLALLPIPDGSDGEKHIFFKPTMQLAASANSDHPEEAARLIDFLINDPEAGEIFGTSLGVPSTEAQREAMTIEEGSVDARVLEFEESLAGYTTAVAPLPVEGFGALEADYRRLGEELAYGNITVDQFVEQWFNEAETTLR